MFTHAVRLFTIVLLLLAFIPAAKTDASLARFTLKHGPVQFNDLPKIQFPQHAFVDKNIHLVLTASGKHCLTVYKNKKRVWVDIPGRWHPWKLVTADVDGDGRKEIIVGVYKSTKFYPFPHPCLFIFQWNGDHMTPMWLGSSLSRPFIDFQLIHQSKSSGKSQPVADELVSIELMADKRYCVTAYHWRQFGFIGDWQQGSWKSVRFLSPTSGKVKIKADNRVLTFNMRQPNGQ